MTTAYFSILTFYKIALKTPFFYSHRMTSYFVKILGGNCIRFFFIRGGELYMVIFYYRGSCILLFLKTIYFLYLSRIFMLYILKSRVSFTAAFACKNEKQHITLNIWMAMGGGAKYGTVSLAWFYQGGKYRTVFLVWHFQEGGGKYGIAFFA